MTTTATVPTEAKIIVRFGHHLDAGLSPLDAAVRTAFDVQDAARAAGWSDHEAARAAVVTVQYLGELVAEAARNVMEQV